MTVKLKLDFVITCNGKNPVPYKRTTQQGCRFDKNYKKYQEWKTEVQWAFINEIKVHPVDILEKDTKYRVETFIYFKDKTHGDPDNIQKGIKDAIFMKPLSDKYCSGSYDFAYDKNNPRVEVLIKEI